MTAFEKLHREWPNARLTLITKVEDIGEPYLQRIAQHPAITLHEFAFRREELVERVYPAADVLWFPPTKTASASSSKR